MVTSGLALPEWWAGGFWRVNSEQVEGPEIFLVIILTFASIYLDEGKICNIYIFMQHKTCKKYENMNFFAQTMT